jgi:hypothetical protein
MAYVGKLEYAHERKTRERNTTVYRALHWPLWIWVFFIAPGPLTFTMFAKGFGWGHLVWLTIVMAGTGVAAYFGQLPGAEPKPYILRFDEDKPNPIYRRVCYTFAWSAVLTFATLNLVGIICAAATGTWYLKQIYAYGYFPVSGLVLLLGALGLLPRVGKSTKGEGRERRYFYGSVWSVTISQTLLMFAWKGLPQTQEASLLKLGIYVAALVVTGIAASRGAFPRTRPILPGEEMVAD